MATHTFHASSGDDWAQSFSFSHDFPAAGAICELSITAANELDDQAGTSLGFLSYTYEDPDGTPHDVSIDYGSRRSAIGHDRMIRVDWYLRIYEADSAGLLNIFFWESVTP